MNESKESFRAYMYAGVSLGGTPTLDQPVYPYLAEVSKEPVIAGPEPGGRSQPAANIDENCSLRTVSVQSATAMQLHVQIEEPPIGARDFQHRVTPRANL